MRSLDVLDCCAASGKIWKQLRQEFKVKRYTRMRHRAAVASCLKIDSARYLATGKWEHNVIDIDTFGNPFALWLAMLPHVKTTTVVFLTISIGFAKGNSVWKSTATALGLNGVEPPPGMASG